jgi:hypothetical protein
MCLFDPFSKKLHLSYSFDTPANMVANCELHEQKDTSTKASPWTLQKHSYLIYLSKDLSTCVRMCSFYTGLGQAVSDQAVCMHSAVMAYLLCRTYPHCLGLFAECITWRKSTTQSFSDSCKNTELVEASQTSFTLEKYGILQSIYSAS